LKDSKKVLILTYYWPPSGGSGVQRWMYFTKYLRQLGWTPIVITVGETKASYPVLDFELLEEVKDIQVIRTNTKEPLKIYSQILTGSTIKSIPQGAVSKKGWFSKIAAFVRGNFFIPDARKGWNAYAKMEAEKLIRQHGIRKLITTGPPHSTHLLGLQLKAQFGIQWWADFRDPWTDIFYNKDLYRTAWAKRIDARWEEKVLQSADGILTTVGGDLVRKLQTKAPDQSFYVLPNGYDAPLMSSVPKTQLKVFHVVYTGLLTENQDYLSPIGVLDTLADQHQIRLSLAGNIAPVIIEKIKETAPKIQVDYKGYLSHQEAIALMKSGDLLLNFIFRGADRDMISGKLLEYLATAIPLLSIGDPQSEAARFLDQASFAQMIDANDIDAQEIFIQKVAQQKGKAKNILPEIENWSRENITKGLNVIME
jgi:glycosyltransferase involved in cell wall biosynthesis